MVDANLIAVKLAELAERVGRVRGHAKASAEVLAADRDALDIVSFNLMLAVQACLDLASHIIADEGWAPATTLAESFRRLAEHGVIAPQTAAALGAAAGLRDVVAHGYAGVDPEKVHLAATRGTGDLDEFAREVARWAASR
jgi:uncharacterized protein YutE (UPF0331/DUF86 family)